MRWEIVQEGAGNCLKTEAAGQTGYAEGIFMYQDLPVFLSCENRLINGNKEAFYDITGKVSLSRYLTEGRFCLADIKNLFRQILDMEDTLEEYLLEGSGLVVHQDFLFVDRKTMSLSGIYHGQRTDGDIRAIGKLLEYMMDCMEQDDKELVFFIYGMHKLTRNPGCTRRDLSAYLCEGKEDGPHNFLKSDTRADILPLSDSLKSSRESGGGRNKKANPGRVGQDGKARRIPVLSAVILCLGIIIPLLLLLSGMFSMPLSGEINWGKFLAAGAFFLGVSGYGAWRAAGLGMRVRAETERDKWQLCLIPVRSGGELIPVRSFPFMIGGDEKRADKRLDGSGVSGRHLQIVQEAGEVFAIDQESADGTWRNDCRMVPWQREALKDGDILSIGNHAFVVELTSSEYVI